MSGRKWFPSPKRLESPRLRVFCFPHAGGSAASFRPWVARIPGDVELLGVQLPGRGGRWGEPPVDRVETLVEALLPWLEQELDVPYLLFGHSFGAIVAYEVTRALLAKGARPPRGLLVSGYQSPHLPTRIPKVSHLDNEELIGWLRQSGGTPREILDSRELLALVMPAFRSDARAYEGYTPRVDPPLPVPITAFCGTNDALVVAGDMEAWASRTTAGFRLHRFEGGHFFLHEAPEQFLPVLLGELG